MFSIDLFLVCPYIVLCKCPCFYSERQIWQQFSEFTQLILSGTLSGFEHISKVTICYHIKLYLSIFSFYWSRNGVVNIILLLDILIFSSVFAFASSVLHTSWLPTQAF